MTFTASNGARVGERFDGGVRVKTGEGGRVYATGIFPREVDALREYFRHERDEKLGRWRYPDDPNVLVYPVTSDGTEVRVVDEGDGSSLVTNALEASEVTGGLHYFAARAYFDAHLTPRPIKVQVERLGGGWVDVIEYTPGDDAQMEHAAHQLRYLRDSDLRARIIRDDEEEF